MPFAWWISKTCTKRRRTSSAITAASMRVKIFPKRSEHLWGLKKGSCLSSVVPAKSVSWFSTKHRVSQRILKWWSLLPKKHVHIFYFKTHIYIYYICIYIYGGFLYTPNHPSQSIVVLKHAWWPRHGSSPLAPPWFPMAQVQVQVFESIRQDEIKTPSGPATNMMIYWVYILYITVYI